MRQGFGRQVAALRRDKSHEAAFRPARAVWDAVARLPPQRGSGARETCAVGSACCPPCGRTNARVSRAPDRRFRPAGMTELILAPGPIPRVALAPCPVRRCVVQNRNRFPSWTLRFPCTPEAITPSARPGIRKVRFLADLPHAWAEPVYARSMPGRIGEAVSYNFRDQVFDFWADVFSASYKQRTSRSYKNDTGVIPAERPSTSSG